MNDITDKLLIRASESDDIKELCPRHKGNLDYFCETCKDTLCADC